MVADTGACLSTMANPCFGSPRRLDLRLGCAPGTPVRDTLDVWPTLPLAISTYDSPTRGRLENMLAVLEHSHRVCQIRLLDHLENPSR